jgi:hypothetical protein
MPSVGMSVTIWKMRQKMKDSPENDMMKVVGRYPKFPLIREGCLLW